jgi:AraC family transcriptional regulator
MSHRVVELGPIHLIGLRGVFTSATIPKIPELWSRFVPRIVEIQDRRPEATFGTCRMTPAKELEYTAAVAVTKEGPAPAGLAPFTLPAGAFAVFTHEGHIRDIGKTWDLIWTTWMKEAGLRHRDGEHDFERYDERWRPETGEGPVDIHIAIERPRG